MSPASDTRYFGKSAFSYLQNVTDVVKGVMSGETTKEEEVKKEESEVSTTEQEKTDG